MKRVVRGIVAVSSLALAGTTFVAFPAAAAQEGKKDPYTTVQQLDETIPLGPGEACNFAVTLRLRGTLTHFEKGRRVVDTTTHSSAVITNDRTGERIRLNTNARFSDRIAKDGNSTRSSGSGNQLFWGDITFNARDAKPRMIYIQGKTRFRGEEALSEADSYVRFTSIKGKVRNICQELRR